MTLPGLPDRDREVAIYALSERYRVAIMVIRKEITKLGGEMHTHLQEGQHLGSAASNELVEAALPPI